MKRRLNVWVLRLLVVLTLGAGHCFSQVGPINAVQKVLADTTFRERLVWTGTNEPNEEESTRLLEVVTDNGANWRSGIESFLSQYPHSPWAASLHQDYAMYCKRSGRTSKALEHWEAAWNLVKDDPSPAAKRLGGTILANWTEQLSSLGREDKLREIIPAGERWPFAEAQERQRFLAAENACLLMESHPELSFRCGTFALKAVGLALQPTNRALDTLVGMPSPTNGFSLSALAEMAAQFGLPLVPVRRNPGAEDIIVPSVIHWRQNHYAAILAEKDGAYLVDDPTFGKPSWMIKNAINEEASGAFLIPAAAQKAGWMRLDRTEMAAIHGMGLPANVNDGNDRGCSRDAAGNMVCACTGMPVWWVSEPYINMWLADEPLSYLTSTGEPFTFRTSYKQRDTMPVLSTGSYVAITGWEHSWLSYIHAIGAPCGNPNTICQVPVDPTNVVLYLPGGGEVDFNSQSYNAENRLLLYIAGSTANALTIDFETGANGLRLIHADGSQDLYDFAHPYPVHNGEPQECDYMLTRRIDRHGRTTRYYYETFLGTDQIRVKYVVDPDGRTNTLTYADSSQTTRLASVSNAYGASVHFSYDGNHNLTNIVDAQGLSSSLTYDTNGYPTSLTTPYGTNTFRLADLSVLNNVVSTEGNFGNHNMIDRAALVTDAAGGGHAYLYRFDCSGFMATNFSSSDVPTNTPLGTLDDGTSGGSNFLTASCYRNSFSWDTRQFAGVVANDSNISATNVLSLTNLSSNDYLRGRMKHWLQDTNQLATYVTSFLSVDRAPSPDGSTEGLKTFYDYQGKSLNFIAGTNPLPSVTAWRLPGGDTHYEYLLYDYFGNVTNRTTTYTLANGSVGTRSTQFVYADNTYTNVIGAWDGTTLFSPATNYFTVPNLLTQVIGPDGTNIVSFAGYEGITWTNDFSAPFSSTNRVLLMSQRVLPDFSIDGINETNTLFLSGFNQIAGIKWASGLTTTNLYDTNGFWVKTVDVETQRTNLFAYSTNGLPSTVTNESGLVVNLFWDNLLRLAGATFPDSTSISNIYANLDLGARKDRLGNWTSFTHDPLRHLQVVSNANQAITLLDWCACGALSSITNALTNATFFYYDNQGRLTNEVFADASGLAFQYDLAGRLTNVFDGSGRFAQLAYNNQGLVTNVNTAAGAVRKVIFDILDRPAVVTDANGITLTNGFDALNRLISRLWPDGVSEGALYASNGLVAYTNRNQKVTNLGRDAAGRLIAVTNANLETNLIRYDAANRITNLIDGLAHATSWQYNQFGWLTGKVDNVGHSVFTNGYDSDGRLTSRWMPAGGLTSYQYDAVGNLTNITYSGGSVTAGISYAYDKLNELTNMIDAAGTTVFSYTLTGQLQSEDGPWSNDTVTLSYNQGYTTNLNLLQPGVSALNFAYTYDSLWRMSNLTSLAGTFTYGYNSAVSPLVQGIALPNYASVSNHYNSLARLDSTALLNYWGHVLDGASYGFDALGLRTNLTRNLGLTTNIVALGYDNIGQLINWKGQETNGTPRWNEQLGYGYDAADNLHLRTNSALVQTFNVDSLNQLSNVTRTGSFTLTGATPAPTTNLSVNGSTAQFYSDLTFAGTNISLSDGNNSFTIIASNIYNLKTTNAFTVDLPVTVTLQSDSNGNLTSDGTRSFIYDADNQLTNVNVSGQWKTEFVYDGLGRRRIERDYNWQGGNWVRTNEARFIFDGMLPIQERDSNNAVLVTYTRGLDLGGSRHSAGGIGGLLARTDSNGSSFYHADGAGNVTTLIDVNQNITARYEYDPFGKLVGKWGTNADVNRNRFSSMPYFTNAGIVGFWQRFYEPGFQRWLNQDPIGEAGGVNLYAFVNNSPLNVLDPTGLFSFGQLLSIAGGFLQGAAEGLENEVIGVGKLAKGMTWDVGVELGNIAFDVDEANAGGDQFDSHLFRWVYNGSLQGETGAGFAKDALLNLSGINAIEGFIHTVHCAFTTGNFDQLSQSLGQLAALGLAPEAAELTSEVKIPNPFAANAAPRLVNAQTIQAALEGSTMRTIQEEVSIPAVESYVRMLESGSTPPPIQVADEVIIDGNHRYVAGRVFGTEPSAIPGTLPPSQAAQVRSVQQLNLNPADFGNR